jgi:hypothetical protein
VDVLARNTPQCPFVINLEWIDADWAESADSALLLSLPLLSFCYVLVACSGAKSTIGVFNRPFSCRPLHLRPEMAVRTSVTTDPHLTPEKETSMRITKLPVLRPCESGISSFVVVSRLC